MTQPLEEYEQEVNSAMDAQIIESQMRKAVLEKERRMLEDKGSKGKAEASKPRNWRTRPKRSPLFMKPSR
mgnify:CR=1 FL=1